MRITTSRWLRGAGGIALAIAVVTLITAGTTVVQQRTVVGPGLGIALQKEQPAEATDLVPLSVASLSAPVIPQPVATPTPDVTGRPFPPVSVTTRAAVIVKGMGADADAITQALTQVEGVVATTRIHVADVQLGGVPAQVAAVDLDTFREFTPERTANHTPLWQRLDAGDVAVTYEFGETHKVELGSLLAMGPEDAPTRVGAFATNGTPPLADAIVSLAVLEQLGGAAEEVMLIGLAPDASPTAAVDQLAEFGLTAEQVPDPRLPSSQTVIPASGITPENVWDHLALCESSGDWHINTGNGYYGGIQFLPESWRWVGGTGLPHEHSREEQIYRGSLLWQIQGWEAWPQCARKLGLIVDAPAQPAPAQAATPAATPGPDSPGMS